MIVNEQAQRYLLVFSVSSLVINVYGHLGYEVTPKWFRHSILFQIFNSSTHHNLHHEKFKGNYGLYFRFWDRVMGTEHPAYVAQYDRIQEQRFGSTTQSKAPTQPKSHLHPQHQLLVTEKVV